ncbi:hypothetical protein DPMN_014964 [Dreissena polymorpha]|uniref:Uncharacterized protein n=1 Tax=Dreissena polymorpha TaxID=45954 RepID=A0A9D4NAN1_DREPO|nr:hypothetical protein DPMN_014964 [Dreissena polymorpha]
MKWGSNGMNRDSTKKVLKCLYLRESPGRTGYDRRGTGNNRDGTGNNRDGTVAPPGAYRPRQSYDNASVVAGGAPVNFGRVPV